MKLLLRRVRGRERGGVGYQHTVCKKMSTSNSRAACSSDREAIMRALRARKSPHAAAAGASVAGASVAGASAHAVGVETDGDTTMVESAAPAQSAVREPSALSPVAALWAAMAKESSIAGAAALVQAIETGADVFEF